MAICSVTLVQNTADRLAASQHHLLYPVLWWEIFDWNNEILWLRQRNRESSPQGLVWTHSSNPRCFWSLFKPRELGFSLAWQSCSFDSMPQILFSLFNMFTEYSIDIYVVCDAEHNQDISTISHKNLSSLLLRLISWEKEPSNLTCLYLRDLNNITNCPHT